MRLVDLISVEMLQKVQDNFSAAVGVAVTIVDERGEPVTRSGGFSAFCKAIRSTEARRERCIHCDNEGGRMAGVAGEPSIYRCHCGLVDFAARYRKSSESMLYAIEIRRICARPTPITRMTSYFTHVDTAL